MQFTFKEAAPTSAAVVAYLLRHYVQHGYPLDTIPAATDWTAMIAADKAGELHIYGVFGYRMLADGGVEVTDFYVEKGRIGVLAGYAALEHIKAECDRTGAYVVTMTPSGNTQMIEAYKKIFNIEQPARTLDVYRYDPPRVAADVAV